MQRNRPAFRFSCREDVEHRAGKKIVLGIVLILVGICFFLAQAGYIENRTVGFLWPLIFSVFGLNRVLFSHSDYSRIKGMLQIFLGFWLFACLDHLLGWTFAMTWPMILIATGLCYIASYLFKDQRDDQNSQSETQP